MHPGRGKGGAQEMEYGCLGGLVLISLNFGLGFPRKTVYSSREIKRNLRESSVVPILYVLPP